jgi:hypothetical protein
MLLVVPLFSPRSRQIAAVVNLQCADLAGDDQEP